MIQRIVVGVDDSDTAFAAAHKAAEIAQLAQAELKVISTYDKFSRDRPTSDDIALNSEQAALTIASTVVTRLTQEFEGLTIAAVTTVGKPSDALVATAEQLEADLIVVGNKRAQGITRVLGSVAQHVTAHAPCDVYVVHTHTTR